MSLQHFGHLQIDPARNPAVLNTATWQPEVVAAAVAALPVTTWDQVRATVEALASPGPQPPFSFGAGRRSGTDACVWVAARLHDGQQALLLFRAAAAPTGLPQPLCRRVLSAGWTLEVLAADADHVAAFVRLVAPECGPQALGPVARLGIGTRLSTHVWPGIWAAMRQEHFAANAIQNSVRELNLLADLVSGAAPRVNYLFGFGRLEEGHTGSTFEGLWLAGVLSALWTGHALRYGADADHIMVKRTPDGLERAKAVVDAACHYTFFTLDVSDLLDYEAGQAAGTAATQAVFAAALPAATQRRELLAWHGEPHGDAPALSPESVARGAAKFGRALDAVAALAARVRQRRGGLPFDLELSIDEVPPGIPVAAVLTNVDEVAFLLGEFRRRGLPVTHVAPNLGIEKGTDYRLADGLDGLQRRTRALQRRLRAAGLMLDCHSGDDLSAATRQAVGQATDGDVHFKVSPSLQVLFAEVLHAEAPALFRFWWDDTLAYAQREAEAGSPVATRLLAESATAAPAPQHALFHQFCFATLGRRSPEGGFLNRERFYTLPARIGQVYAERVTRLLLEVAADVYGEH